MNPALTAILINSAFMFLALFIAFAKVCRPISWGAFYFNLFAAGLNLIAVILHVRSWLSVSG